MQNPRRYKGKGIQTALNSAVSSASCSWSALKNLPGFWSSLYVVALPFIQWIFIEMFPWVWRKILGSKDWLLPIAWSSLEAKPVLSVRVKCSCVCQEYQECRWEKTRDYRGGCWELKGSRRLYRREEAWNRPWVKQDFHRGQWWGQKGKDAYIKKREGRKYVWEQERNKINWNPLSVLVLEIGEKIMGYFDNVASLG